jgi:hypothetical protein
MGTDNLMPRHVFHKSFTVRFAERSKWDRGSIPVKNGGLVWFTDTRQMKEMGSGEAEV